MHRASPRIFFAALALAAAGLTLSGFRLLEGRRQGLGVPPSLLASVLAWSLALGLLVLVLRRSWGAEAARDHALKESIDEAIRALGETHQILLSTFESMTDGFVSLDFNWRYTYVNRRAGEMLGKAPEELVGRVIWEVFPEGVGKPFHRLYEQAMKERVPRVIEEHYAPWDRWFENRIYPFPGGIAIFFQEITERKTAERRLQKLNRTYALLSSVNHAILRSRPPQEIFDEACRIAVEQGGLGMAWVGLLDAESRKVRPVAHMGAAGDYLERLDIALDSPERGHGPTATALLSGERVVVNDMAQDPRVAPWREEALRLGFRASAAFPLLVSGRARGTFNLYAPEAGFFDEEELGLLDQMVSDIAFSLEFAEKDEQRRQTERQLSLIYSSISDVLFYLAVEGPDQFRFLSVNAAFLKATGLGEAQVVGRLVQEVIPEPALAAVLERYKEALRTRTAVAWEEVSVYPAGTKYGEVSVAPILDEAGECTRLLGTVHDITDRKLAEEALRKSELRYRTMFTKAPSGIALIDSLTGRFLEVNPRYEEIAGRTREEMLRIDWKAITHPDDVQADQDHMARMNAGGTPGFKMEKRYLRPDGSVVWIEMTVAALREDPEHPRHLAMIDDITERLQAAAEIRALNAQLELRVAQRTAQLEAANRELESFSYSVSHDLRAPLRAISGFAAIIARRHQGELDEEGRHFVDNIVQASARMGHLIEDLLNYSRLGRAGVRREPVRLPGLLSEIRRNLQDRIDEARGSVEIAEDLPTVTGDPTLLVQAFTNLLENAITYHKEGQPPRVVVRGRVEGGQALVEVRDNGIGIAPEYQEKIFNMFQRLHSDEEFPGTGIGLANVRKSIGLLGGRVWVESKVGEGSTFFIQLPKE